MLDFELFRIKVFPTDQRSLFATTEFNPSLALVAAIEKTPSRQTRSGHTWHIGNVEKVDDFGIYFALGRTTKTTKGLFDESTHRFYEVADENVPFTHVFCDSSREVCGIAKQHDLAQVVGNIARQLERLLNATTNEGNSTGYRFEISAIRDPADFLEQIREAHAVTRFAVTFSLPNAWDTGEDIKVLENYAVATKARKGLVQVTGADLDRKTIEAVARSSAALGNDVTASIRTARKSRPVTRSIKGNPATIKEDADVSNNQQKRGVLGSIRKLYGQIKRGG